MTGAEAPAGRLGALLFACLVIASFAAFFLAQRLKHIPTAVQQLKFDAAFYPQGGGAPAQEPISFEIERPDRVTVQILDTRGVSVATLLRESYRVAYAPIETYWNGRLGASRTGGQPAGMFAPEGEYRVRIALSGRKFHVRSPSSIELVRRAR